jgi:hypothetical protein
MKYKAAKAVIPATLVRILGRYNLKQVYIHNAAYYPKDLQIKTD